MRIALTFLGAPALATALVACGSDGDGGPALPAEAEEGRRIALRNGCSACHGANGEGGTGPAWRGIYGTTVELEDGTTATIDDAYLTTAIAEPDAQVHAGYSIAMPVNQLGDDEIAQVVAYIRALDATEATSG